MRLWIFLLLVVGNVWSHSYAQSSADGLYEKCEQLFNRKEYVAAYRACNKLAYDGDLRAMFVHSVILWSGAAAPTVPVDRDRAARIMERISTEPEIGHFGNTVLEARRQLPIIKCTLFFEQDRFDLAYPYCKQAGDSGDLNMAYRQSQILWSGTRKVRAYNAQPDLDERAEALDILERISKENDVGQYNEVIQLAKADVPKLRAVLEQQKADKIRRLKESEDAATQAKATAAALAAAATTKANLPSEQLKGVYESQLAIQACYESRKNFLVKYVTQQEYDNARAVTKREESKLVKKYPELFKQKNDIWESAKKEFSSTSLIALGVAISGESYNPVLAKYCSLTKLGFNLDPEIRQNKMKKDF